MNTQQNRNCISILLATLLSLFKRKTKKRCHDVPLSQRDTCMPNDIRICKKCSDYY